jgi:hypothetical protein
MNDRIHLIASLAAALLRNSGFQAGHLTGEPGRATQAGHYRRLIARAAVALADSILDEAAADKPALKLAHPEADHEPDMIDLNLDLPVEGD